MATGKSHGICNEMQGILSKHSYVCLCVLGTECSFVAQTALSLPQKVGTSDSKCYFCMGSFNWTHH